MEFGKGNKSVIKIVEDHTVIKLIEFQVENILMFNY
jgi:hypothetical protein